MVLPNCHSSSVCELRAGLAIHAVGDAMVLEQASEDLIGGLTAPRSMLRTSGVPCRAMASSTAWRQEPVSIVIESCQASTRRL